MDAGAKRGPACWTVDIQIPAGKKVTMKHMVGNMVFTVMVATQAWAACGETGVALQVLGSGGPFGVGRASAGYIVWVDGASRFMIDAGGVRLPDFTKLVHAWQSSSCRP